MEILCGILVGAVMAALVLYAYVSFKKYGDE